MESLTCAAYIFLVWTLFWFLRALASRTKLHSMATTTANLPPGPTPFPIISNLHSLGDKPHKSIAAFAKTYGPIITLKFGGITTIVVSSSSIVKEILQKNDILFSNRIIPEAVRALDHHQSSIVFLPLSSQWRSLRKICNSFMFIKSKLEVKQDLRRRKVQQLVEYVAECSNGGVAVDIGKAAFTCSLNLLSNTIFSQDLADYTSEKTQEFKDAVFGITEEGGTPNFGDNLSVLTRFDLQGIRKRMTGHCEMMVRHFDELINARMVYRKRPADYVTSSDILDALLDIEEKSQEIDRNGIHHFLLDLFTAETYTTTITLEWAMAELLHNPKIMSKAKDELSKNIGTRSGWIEEDDIPKLPYLQAIMKETFRPHPPVPFLARKVKTNIQINGYMLPKDSQLLVNVWAMGRDPSVWNESPDVFMPERFVDSDIDVKGRTFELIPFGAGRRICPGAPLAHRMVHVMLGSLLHCFDWKLGDGISPQDMDLDDKFGMTVPMARPLCAFPISRSMF